MGDTLAFRSDEGRGYRRNASGSWKQATIRRSPNEETQRLLIEYIDKKERTQGIETSQYLEEKKVKTIPLVAASETGTA